jgi:hypothetical protein
MSTYFLAYVLTFTLPAFPDVKHVEVSRHATMAECVKAGQMLDMSTTVVIKFQCDRAT